MIASKSILRKYGNYYWKDSSPLYEGEGDGSSATHRLIGLSGLEKIDLDKDQGLTYGAISTIQVL